MSKRTIGCKSDIVLCGPVLDSDSVSEDSVRDFNVASVMAIRLQIVLAAHLPLPGGLLMQGRFVEAGPG